MKPITYALSGALVVVALSLGAPDVWAQARGQQGGGGGGGGARTNSGGGGGGGTAGSRGSGGSAGGTSGGHVSSGSSGSRVSGPSTLTSAERIAQGEEIEAGLRFTEERGVPHISRYDIREFVY